MTSRHFLPPPPPQVAITPLIASLRGPATNIVNPAAGAPPDLGGGNLPESIVCRSAQDCECDNDITLPETDTRDGPAAAGDGNLDPAAAFKGDRRRGSPSRLVRSIWRRNAAVVGPAVQRED